MPLVAAGLQPSPPPLPPVVVDEGDMLANSPAAALPVEMEVGVPVRDFRVRHLLALKLGQVIESQWSHVEDVPIGAGNVQLAWSEFEVLDLQMAVRLTRLA